MMGIASNSTTCKQTNRFLGRMLSVFFVFLLAAQFSSTAQTAQIARPSCNLSGTLEISAVSSRGQVNVPNITVLAEVAKSEAHTTLAYSFPSNSSGASILTYGPVNYNPATKKTTQQLTIYPGVRGNEFNLELKVSNSNGGSCNCSKSVTITPVSR